MLLNRSFPVVIQDIPISHAVEFCLADGPYRYVVTPNVDHMCRIYDDLAMRRLYAEADLCVCDSKILQYISILKRSPIRNVVRGSDLVERLLHCVEKDRRVFILGSTIDLGPAVSARFGLDNVSVVAPEFGFERSAPALEAIVRGIEAFAPDLVLLAVGSPRQEHVAQMLAARLSKGVAVCCGNAVSFAVGSAKRSPRWMSQFGLEWLHRMFQEPSRLIPRYVGNLRIFLKAFLQ
jgi:N-acetylglucosaminyldiphosphoundecaprenol N-acetyl-beta-D-mannosaminyltransferase